MPNIDVLVFEQAGFRVELEAESREGIAALTEAEILLHRNQPRRALGPDVVWEGGWEEQRGVDDVTLSEVGGGGELWLVNLLILTELLELATEECALFDDFCWEVVWRVFCDDRLELHPVQVSESRRTIEEILTGGVRGPDRRGGISCAYNGRNPPVSIGPVLAPL